MVKGRYQRRTTRLTAQVKAVVKQLAGRAGARVLAILAVGLSRHTALRALLRIPLPTGRVSRVIGVDDFALRRRHRYATVVIDAETHERIDVLPDRTADTLEAWLREHPGVEIVCRDGSATYAEAIRRALPDAVRVGDRWHLWHNLCEAALSGIKAHSTCWATVLEAPLHEGPRARTILERWHQIHDLLDQGVGLLECGRRLRLALNTIRRYARADRPERMLRVPKYRAGLVDPYREHLRKRRADDPAVPSSTSSKRSRPLASRAASTSRTSTSTKAARTPTAAISPHADSPGCSSPGPTTSRPSTTTSWPDSPPPAPS